MTMTYLEDSDIHFPYGYMVAEPTKDSNPVSLEHKTGLVIWIVSACNVRWRNEIAEVCIYIVN